MAWEEYPGFKEPELERTGKYANGEAPPQLEQPRSMASLAGKAIPELHYIVDRWIPLGKPVLACGPGGGGKTTLVCQLAAARAIGVPFLGLTTDRGISLTIHCEEDEHDMHRMLANLADNRFHCSMDQFKDFYYLARAGKDNVLIWRDRRGNVQVTPMYLELQTMILDIKPTFLALDNSRHIAMIDENNGAEVTAAWSLIHGLMTSVSGTTLLVGHTPKNKSAEFSGNAAWENVARCRMYLGSRKIDADEEEVENDPRRILRRGKSNASGTDEMCIVWENGSFRLEQEDLGTFGDHLDREMRNRQCGQTFLDALSTLNEQRRSASHMYTARNYAPRLIVTAGLAGGFTIKELTAGMELLFREGKIKAGQELWKGTDRHSVVGIGATLPSPQP